ncbi:hypothetical protein Pint_05298 [Pistacia integerrima]|uniref:Uncharacterized protein n=1 Tax=Pistacia integerrima TaxID=434235 RepID=A0ACC0Z1V1_9ROSI|nr:hypothetical protein Pint_05298 [Pistacia integerrima]
MKYLKKTTNYCLHYKRYPSVLEGYSDAGWNTLLDDSKSTTDYIFTMGGGAITWISKKQHIISQSTMEAELISLASASEKASWLKDLLSEMTLGKKPNPSILIHCDSIACIGRTRNKYYNGKLRSIRRKHSTLRSYLTNGTINMDYVRSNENLADPLTKTLS